MTQNLFDTTDIVDWNIVTTQKAKIGYERASEMIRSTVKVKDALEDKAFKFITILSPILTAAITLLISLLYSNQRDFLILTPLCIFIIFISISLSFSINIFYPKGVYLPGGEPKNFFEREFLEQNERSVLVGLCNQMQKHINHNDNLNKTVAKKLMYAINAFCLALFFAFSSFLYIKYVSIIF